MNAQDKRELHYFALKKLAIWVRKALPDIQPCSVMSSNHRAEDCPGCALGEIDRYDPERKPDEFPCAPI